MTSHEVAIGFVGALIGAAAAVLAQFLAIKSAKKIAAHQARIATLTTKKVDAYGEILAAMSRMIILSESILRYLSSFLADDPLEKQALRAYSVASAYLTDVATDELLSSLRNPDEKKEIVFHAKKTTHRLLRLLREERDNLYDATNRALVVVGDDAILKPLAQFNQKITDFLADVSKPPDQEKAKELQAILNLASTVSDNLRRDLQADVAGV